MRKQDPLLVACSQALSCSRVFLLSRIVSPGEGESEVTVEVSLTTHISDGFLYPNVYYILRMIFLYSFSFEEKCFPLSFLLYTVDR